METITSRHNPLGGASAPPCLLRELPARAGRVSLRQPEAAARGTAARGGASDRRRDARHGAAGRASHAGVRLVEVPEDVMQLISPAKTPQGVVFTCRLPRTECPQTLTGARYLALDGVQDPGNVGTIPAHARRVRGGRLVLLPGCADPFSPKTVRSSMGAVFRRPVWTCTAETFAQVLRGSGLRLLGAALPG